MPSPTLLTFSYLAPQAKALVFRFLYDPALEPTLIHVLLRRAFGEKDGYRRDWLLLQARAHFDKEDVQRKFETIRQWEQRGEPRDKPFAITVSALKPNTKVDQLLWYVQKHLSDSMAICCNRDCPRRYYFRGPHSPKQKNCAGCKRQSKKRNQRKWWAAKGKAQRIARRLA